MQPQGQVTAKGVPHPRVGIFWWIDGRLIREQSTLDRAEACGDFLDHERGHYEYWGELQDAGEVPREVEYDEPPRGRVLYNRTARRFVVRVDRCILRSPEAMGRIREAFQLPARGVHRERDEHYRCERCLAPDR